MTRDQFINQSAFWQDKYYSYAIHITDGGAIYLYQIDGTLLTKDQLATMRTIRLDGTDIDTLCKKLKKETK